MACSSAKNLLLNDKNDRVAIKKISNCFENVIDAKRTLREIKLVRHLNHGVVVIALDRPCMEALASSFGGSA